MVQSFWKTKICLLCVCVCVCVWYMCDVSGWAGHTLVLIQQFYFQVFICVNGKHMSTQSLMSMFITVLWKVINWKYPSVRMARNYGIYIHTMAHHSAINGTELSINNELPTTIWMNLKNILLSKRIQTHKSINNIYNK